MSSPDMEQPRSASGSISRPAPHATSRTRASSKRRSLSQRNATSARVASSGSAACQNSTARPEKHSRHQSGFALLSLIDLPVEDLHVTHRVLDLPKTGLSIEPMCIPCRQHPLPEALELRMGANRLHQPDPETVAAVGLQDEHVADIGEGRSV